MLERGRSVACTALAAALLLGPAMPCAAHAATPSKDADLTDVQSVFDTMPLGASRYALVGCDGTSPSRVGRIQMFDVKSGKIVWQDSIAGSNACFLGVVATPARVYVWGNVADSDGDGGSNLLVQARDAKTGAVVWQQEIEAPNPKQGINKQLIGRPNMTLQGSKLMILAGTTGAANPTILLRLDANTGALLPAN